MEKFPIFENKKFEPKLLFKAILMRHQEATYLEDYPGLTERGVGGAGVTGLEMKEDNFFPDKDEVVSFNSPLIRTKGTLDIAGKAAGINTENSSAIKMLRSSDVFDEEAFDKHTDEELDGDPARIAEAFYTHDIHKNHPEIIEPHAKKKQRLYRAMEYLIRSIMKNDNNRYASVPQIFAVSHFEIITHIIDDAFGIENTGYRSPLPGEQVKIAATTMKEPNKILLDISFRGIEKQVIFDREKRSIEQAV